MADDFKGDYGALGQVYSLPREGYLSQDFGNQTVGPPGILIDEPSPVADYLKSVATTIGDLPSAFGRGIASGVGEIGYASGLVDKGQIEKFRRAMKSSSNLATSEGANPIVSEVAQEFGKLAPAFIPAFKVLRALPFMGRAGSALTAEAISGAVSLDPATPTISEQVNKDFGLDSEILEMLSPDPNDPEIIRRAYQAADVAGIGLAFEGILKTAQSAKKIYDFSKSLSSKLPAAGALGDVAVTPKGIVPDRPIMPAPQRFFDKTNKDYKPFLSDFDFTEGGRYIEMNKSGLKDVTAQQPAAARISVAGDGKPSMLISKELVDTTGSPSEKGSTLVKTNLFKKKAGWKWDKVPKGFDPDPSGDFPLVSVEAKGKHHYSINADFPAGVDLSRYANSKTEPRLRPTTKGKVTLGKKVGDISVRGKKHPVYDNIIVKSAAPIAIGAGALSELPEGSE